MLILGTKPGQHDACFALLLDGEPLFIYEQERFNRIKHGMSCDMSVLLQALDEHSIRPDEIDLVTNSNDPGLLPGRETQVRQYLKGAAADAMVDYLEWRIPTWHRLLLSGGFPRERILNIRHHLCHCAGVYYASPFDDAAILSVDGSGETETAMLAHGSGGKIDVLRTTPHPHSLGHFYQAATLWLGWGFGEEGKTMALAAYGVPRHYRRLRDEVIAIDDDGAFAFAALGEAGSFGYSAQDLANEVFAGLFGPVRGSEEPLSQLHKDVAASTQQICDEIMLASARFLKAETGASNLLVAGGVGLNSVSNGLILREKLFDRMIVYPQANDTGTALGGALYAYHNLGDRDASPRWTMRHACWGREIDMENLDSVAHQFGVGGTRLEDVCEAAADLLAAGNIVGWVQGRAEVGPRALGNRSILANPLVEGIKDKINAKVKHREPWRPFAPSVLKEEVGRYFETDQELPYMTVVAAVRPEWRYRLSSIAHVDGTARVQTVSRDSNPKFHALIEAFRERTGIGILLNTSFNDRGEPLVQTCEQAIELFLRSEMGALVIGDQLFDTKPEDRDPPPFAAYRFNLRNLPQTRLLVICDDERELFVPMLDHLSELNPAVTIAPAPGPDTDQVDADLARNHDGFVFCVPASGDRFVFDRELYFSKAAEVSRALVSRTGLPVFWIDRNGDVTVMNKLLFAQHRHTAPDEVRR